MPAPERTQVFISYSHEDSEWLKRLQIMLRPLTLNQALEVWDDTHIRAGSKWREEIQRAVAVAKVAVLLVSPNFLASEFIANDELPPLLKAAEEGGLTILWVAVRHSLYAETAIAAYQAASNPARPLTSLSASEQDEELVKIAQQIRDAATRPIALRPANSPANTFPQTAGERPVPKQPFEPEMILIPAGEFLMGSDPQQDEYAADNEQPQHRLHLPEFYLAKTPVTRAQYRAFIVATGRGAPRDWANKAPLRVQEDYPVSNVTWYTARQHCQWLSDVTGRDYSLPSEAEWEKGARGIDGRIYPWGDQWDATRCNSGENHLRKIAGVDAHPDGASPYGLLDMVGNIAEWTRSLWGRKLGKPSYIYPYQAHDGREELRASQVVYRVVRGGAFHSDRKDVRCAWRFSLHPNNGGNLIGFRVVVHPAS